MDQSPVSRKREIIAALSVLIVIVAIVGAVTLMNDNDTKDSNTTDTPATSTTTEGASTDEENESAQSTDANYKNGQYTATGSYDSPGGPEEITVNVTLKDGIISDTSATAEPSGATAEEYQGKFLSGYKQLVVGKAIDSVSLDRVSGSSLTSEGFNSAIDQIIKKAQS